MPTEGAGPEPAGSASDRVDVGGPVRCAECAGAPRSQLLIHRFTTFIWGYPPSVMRWLMRAISAT